MSIDPNNLSGTAHVTFDDEFNNLSLWNGSSGTWATTYWYQDPTASNGASLPSNGEQEWYINSNYGPTHGVTPWTVNNGVLTITATPTPSWLSGSVNNYSYVSGEINTYHAFTQTYGYFEMRAQLPAGQGFWPAFWLMPEDGSWPPELDIVEALGQNPTELVTTSHSADAGMESLWTQVPNMTTGYHTYGLDWESDHITWYFDGRPVYQIATPADMNKPMYVIANLAVGGNWPGSADGYSSAQMNIDYIRAYAAGGSGAAMGGSSATDSGSGGSTSGSSTSTSPSSGDVTWQNWAKVVDGYYAAPAGITDIILSGWSQGIQGNNQGDTFYSSDAQNWLVGGAGNDTFYMGRGGDWAAGAGGANIFKFTQLPWTGDHITDFNTSDALDLTGMLSSLGYWGVNPLADGHMAFVSDGAGGTQIWFDADGLSGGSGTWLVTTLDHVAPSSLSISNGVITESWTSSSSNTASSNSAASGSGQTFWADNNGHALWGGAGDDTFNLGRGGDWVTGGGGADTFKFAAIPWASAHIMDFHSGDLIDLSGMFASVGYSTSNPVADGRLWIGADGAGGTQIWFNANGLGGATGSWQLFDLAHVDPSSLHVNGAFITG